MTAVIAAKPLQAAVVATPAPPPSKDTWALDSSLPRLPVPSIRETLQRLKASCAAVGAPPAELAEFDRLADTAETELAAAQEVLNKRYHSQTNYIGPWWDEFAYLRQRESIVLTSNVFAVRDSDFGPSGQPRPPIRDKFRRAAMLMCESLLFRTLLASGSLPREAQGKSKMCMSQFKRYYCVRQPRAVVDGVCITPARDVRNFHVMYRGAHFIIKAVADDGKASLNYSELLECVKHGVTRLVFPAADECIGLMTTANRDAWANVWKELCTTSLENADNLKLISTAISTICVDDKPVLSLKQGINRAAHGQAHNRWYDRSSLRIVAGNGVVVENGEHSPMDAIVSASTPIDTMIIRGKRATDAGDIDEPARPGFSAAAYVRVLNWEVTPAVKAAIRQAKKEHMDAVRLADIDTYAFDSYGRNLLREYRLNADAFVQQAMQLAFFRDRRKLVPVYESGSTRMFQEGRTEVIRALTTAQRAFILAMDNPEMPVAEKMKLLHAALARHAEVSAEAVSGRGIDRHLMTLKLAQTVVLRRPLPAIFGLKCVIESGQYLLLTSQMIGRLFVGGFAHPYADGYGCCYYLRPNAICMIVSGCTKEGHTSVERFKKQLTAAFHQLIELAKPVQQEDQVAVPEASSTTLSSVKKPQSKL